MLTKESVRNFYEAKYGDHIYKSELTPLEYIQILDLSFDYVASGVNPVTGNKQYNIVFHKPTQEQRDRVSDIMILYDNYIEDIIKH